MDVIEKAKRICIGRNCYDCPLRKTVQCCCGRTIIINPSAFYPSEYRLAVERIENSYNELFSNKITVTESDVIDMLE